MLRPRCQRLRKHKGYLRILEDILKEIALIERTIQVLKEVKMRREVSLPEGMRAAAEGREVLVAVPEEKDGTSYRLMPVQEYFRDCWLIADLETAESQQPEPERQAPLKRRAPRRKQVDVGRIQALHNTHWSVAKIADDMGICENTVYSYLKKMEAQDGKINTEG